MNLIASSFDESSEVGFTRNRIWFDIEASQGWENAEDYSLKAQVWSNDFADKIVEISLSPDADGVATAEIQQVLDAYINPQIPSMSWTDITKLDVPESINLRFVERINQADNTLDIPEPVYFIGAGFDYENKSLALEKNWIENGKFLTNTPSPKPTLMDSPEWLYWFGGLQNQNATVKVTVYFDDATTISYTQFSGNTDGKMIAIPTGYEALSIESATPLGKEVVEWTVEIDGLSGLFRYELTDLNCLEKTIFVYENSLSGFDTLFSDGPKQTLGLDVKKQVSRKHLPRNYAKSDGEYFVSAVAGTRKGVSGTGWLSPEWAESLQELNLSENVFVLKDGKLLPVQVTISDNYYKKDSQLLGYKIDYQFLFDVTSYTNNIIRT